MKVSIITVSYNSVLTIEKTILSVLGQSYRDIEYIIIDGQSTDGTQEIIRKYQHRLAFWVSEKDHGIADAWNKGIRHASGDIIGIINADDVYLEGTVEKAVQVLQAAKEIGFVFGDLRYVDGSGKVLYKQIGDPNYGIHIGCDMPSIPHPTVFVRKEMYEKFGLFDMSYKAALDYEFLLRIHLAGVRGVHIEDVLAEMTVGGVSDAGFRRAYEEVAQISIQYGCSPAWAKARLVFKMAKGQARRWLEKKGFGHVPALYRKMFYDWYKE